MIDLKQENKMLVQSVKSYSENLILSGVNPLSVGSALMAVGSLIIKSECSEGEWKGMFDKILGID